MRSHDARRHDRRSPDARRNRPRTGREYFRVWALAVAIGIVVGWLAPDALGLAVAGLAAWDCAALLLLGHSWLLIRRADVQITREHAAIEDPGKIALFFVSILAATVGLATAVFVLRDPEGFLPRGHGEYAAFLIALGIAAVIGAWLLVHTAYTFHYAHLYYREDGSPGGLDFPGGAEPDDFDFAYFAFTIGMTFQTSDVEVSDREVRRVVLRHALLSFAFNTAILALAVALISGRLQ